MKPKCYCGKPATIKINSLIAPMEVCRRHAQIYIKGFKLMDRIINRPAFN